MLLDEDARRQRLDGVIVEHEGFMSFLAARAGVRVHELVTAGRAGKGDAVIVVRPIGAPPRPSGASNQAAADAAR